MRVVFFQSANKPSDLIANWFASIRESLQKDGGDALMVVKYHKGGCPEGWMFAGDSLSCGIHNLVYQYTGLQDCFSFFSTKALLSKFDEFKPDLIHCHVINDMFINMRLFCDYVNNRNIKVVWTFHDARVLTGQCPYPDYSECDQWKSSCKRCTSANRFLNPSKEWLHCESFVHSYRKLTIGKINRLAVVSPSCWMNSLVEQSYLKDCFKMVIHNGIDQSLFLPEKKNSRIRLGLPCDKKILLAVGNPIWRLKGRDFLLQLIKELPQEFFIVMVGCLQEDLSLLSSMSNVRSFLKVERTDLAAYYSAADLFVNPTLADNFPTVNLEAQACGCPVVAFDSGGTNETIAPKGCVVQRKDFDALKSAILNFDYNGASEDALLFARQFSQERCVREYLSLYKSL